MDYRKLLGKRSIAVLPYTGGLAVDAPDRRLRLEHALEPGFFRFELEGRKARPLERVADPWEELATLPRVRGHFAPTGAREGWLFASGASFEPVHLLPEEEVPVLAPITAHRTPGGELVFGAIELESEVELDARLALEERRPLAGHKGVTPSLRAAYGFSLARALGHERGLHISVREVGALVFALAEEGVPAVERCLAALTAARLAERALTRRHELAVIAHASIRAERAGTARERRTIDPGLRVFDALDKAGARLLATRGIGDGLREVSFRFLGERFVALVRDDTLGVVDAGICLQGHDRVLTLESLPSAIREAIDSGALHITRFDSGGRR